MTKPIPKSAVLPASVEEIQQLRRAAARRLEKIAAGYIPTGWKVTYYARRSYEARCNPKTKTITVPHPRTRRSLRVFLMQCAHVELHAGKSDPTHAEELEAEAWAHARMKENNVHIPRLITRGAKLDAAHRVIGDVILPA